MSWYNNFTSSNAHFHTKIGYEEVGTDTESCGLSEDFFQNLRTEILPLHIFDSPIKIRSKNPFTDMLVCILGEPVIEGFKIKIKWKYEIYSFQREITRIWKVARSAFFRENSDLIREVEIAKKLHTALNLSYATAKQAFEKKFRNIPNHLWMYVKYFEHLKWAALTAIELSLNDPNIYENTDFYMDRIAIAFLHDILEDTHYDFHTLKVMFGEKVALAVLAISKDPWEDFIDYEESRYAAQILEDEKKGKISKDNDWYKKLKKKYKEPRNEKYFPHFTSFKTFKKHIIDIANEKWMSLKEKEINDIARNALISKFSDRIDNLRTEWNPNDTDKVERKVKETIKYFLPIAKEVCPEAYDMMIHEIKILKSELFHKKRRDISTES